MTAVGKELGSWEAERAAAGDELGRGAAWSSFLPEYDSLRRMASSLPRVLPGVDEDEAADLLGSLPTGLDPDEVRRCVAQLPAELSAAVGLFLGLGARHHTIREVASALGISRYAARGRILDGLLAAAASLGVAGALSTRELEACRWVLLEGKPLEEAASALGLTREQVRSSLGKAREVVAAALG